MNTKERLLKDIKWEQSKINKMIEYLSIAPISLVEQAFPEGSWSSYWGVEYEYTLPMRFELIDQFKQFCTDQGYKYKNEQQLIWNESKSAGFFMDVFFNEKDYFHLAFRTGRDGATCVLNKIGEEMKPIFEVICKEGAEEGSF